MRYVKGQVVTVSANFAVEGVPTDPSTVTFKVKDPSNNIETYIYGVDVEVIRLDEGSYSMDIETDESGVWRYRIEADGTVIDAIEKEFEVNRSYF